MTHVSEGLSERERHPGPRNTQANGSPLIVSFTGGGIYPENNFFEDGIQYGGLFIFLKGPKGLCKQYDMRGYIQVVSLSFVFFEELESRAIRGNHLLLEW